MFSIMQNVCKKSPQWLSMDTYDHSIISGFPNVTQHNCWIEINQN